MASTNNEGPKAAVTKNGDAYDVTCDCGFTSTGWTARKEADTRSAEHRAEHATGKTPKESR